MAQKTKLSKTRALCGDMAIIEAKDPYRSSKGIDSHADLAARAESIARETSDLLANEYLATA